LATITLTSYINVPSGTKKIDVIPSIKVPLIANKEQLPSGCTFAMYGTKDSLAMLKRARTKGREQGDDTYRIDLLVEIGEAIAGKATMESLAKTRFLNLQRISAPVAKIIIDLVYDENIVGLTSLVKGRSDAVDVLKIVGKYPYLLDRVWEDSRFKHLGLIVWPAPSVGKKLLDGSDPIEQVTAIKPESISEIKIHNFDGTWENATIEKT